MFARIKAFFAYVVTRTPSPDVPVGVVGSGPFRLPGERRRVERAAAKAQRLMDLVDEAQKR